MAFSFSRNKQIFFIHYKGLIVLGELIIDLLKLLLRYNK